MPTAANLPRDFPLWASRLIVNERTGDWANSLRRWLADGGRWIVETRGFKQLAGAVAEHPVSLCVIEVTHDNALRVATTIEQLHQYHPHAHFIAASQQANPNLAMTLREAGAAYVVQSRRDTDIINQLWQQHCQQHPPREETLRDQIFAALPWSEIPQSAIDIPQSHV